MVGYRETRRLGDEEIGRLGDEEIGRLGGWDADEMETLMRSDVVGGFFT